MNILEIVKFQKIQMYYPIIWILRSIIQMLEIWEQDKAWKLIDNDDNVVNKGWEWIDKYGYLEQPENFNTDERAELPENDIRLLKELLTYCKAENLNVLFVVCPYWITKEHQIKYNAMADMIQSIWISVFKCK